MLQLGPEICNVDSCPHGCTRDDGGCKGTEWRLNHAPQHWRAAAQALIDGAARDGLVVTIEQRPLQPLAMGNHESVVSVRVARKAA